MSALSSAGSVVHPPSEGPGRRHPWSAPSRWRTVVLCVIAVATMFVASMAPMLLVVIPFVQQVLKGSFIGAGTPGLIVASVFVVAAQSLSTVVALVAVRFLSRWTGVRRARIGLAVNGEALRWLGAMMVTALVVGGLVTGVAVLLPDGWTRDGAWGGGGDTWWTAVIVQLSLAFLLQGIPEEVVWRGWLIPALGGGRLAVGLSVGVFTLCHLISNGGQESPVESVIYLVIPAGFAFAAAIAKLVSGSLWAAIGVHAGFHVSTGVWGALGMPDGPVVWTLLGIFWAVVAVILARVFRDRLPWNSGESRDVDAC